MKTKTIEIINDAFFTVNPYIYNVMDGRDMAMKNASVNAAREILNQGRYDIRAALEVLETAGQQVSIYYSRHAAPAYYESDWTKQTADESVLDVFAAVQWDMQEITDYYDWTDDFEMRDLPENEQTATGREFLQDAINRLREADALFEKCSKAIN